MEMRDVEAASHMTGRMADTMGQIIGHFAGVKAANWAGGVIYAGNFARPQNVTKDFGSWAVQVILTASNQGTIDVGLTPLN